MEVYQGNADYIALCFAPDDRDTAEDIVTRLQAANLRVWSSRRGCSPAKEKDLNRLNASRTVIILISAAWLAKPDYQAQLRAAAESEHEPVLIFLGGADLTGHDDLQMMLSRSVRMLDYSPDAPEECFDALLSLESVTDCTMAEGEEPDLKKVSFFDFL